MSDSVGARLREARGLRHLTLAQVAEATKLRTHYLQALESDDYSAIPSAAQARGFLRIYAEFLELDLAEQIAAVQPPPVPASPEAVAAPAAAKPPRASLWAGLRQRLSPRHAKDAEAVPVPPADEPVGLPASSDTQTTRRTKAASQDAKKKHNPVVVPAEPASVTDVSRPSAAALTEQAGPEPIPAPVSDADKAPPASSPRFSLRSLLGGVRSRKAQSAAAAASIEERGLAEPVSSEPKNDEAGASIRADFNPVPLEDSSHTESSDAIFLDIGQQLRARREMLSLTYEEIERHTHVRAVFLAALEGGCLEDLPSAVQTRGILINYAKFLDLDVDAILLRFADGIQARYHEKSPRSPVRSRAPLVVRKTLPPLRGFIASDLIFGGGLAITLLLFAVWGINRVMLVRSQEPARVTPPSISDILVETSLPTLVQQVTVIPAQDTPVSIAAPSDVTATLELATLDPNVKVQVVLTATQSTYMRITVDGKVQFEGRAETGSSYSYNAADQVEVLTGNAAALRVNYNGHDLGLMGNFGEVADRLYTAAGVATPTSTPQPTRTPTPRVTATPTQTPTFTPSPTRTP